MWLDFNTYIIITDKWTSVTNVNTIVLLGMFDEVSKVVDKPLKAIFLYTATHTCTHGSIQYITLEA